MTERESQLLNIVLWAPHVCCGTTPFHTKQFIFKNHTELLLHQALNDLKDDGEANVEERYKNPDIPWVPARGQVVV